MLVYVALALAVAIVVRRGDGPGIFAGALVGVCLVSGYALATRLFPDRLDTPGDAGLPVSALRAARVLELARSAGGDRVPPRSRHRRARQTLGLAVLGGAVLPMLAVTLTSRSAGAPGWRWQSGSVSSGQCWIRAACGCCGRLLVAAPSVAVVAYASRQDALTTEDAPVAQAVREGHRLAVVLGVLALCSAVLAWVARGVSRRVVVTPRLNRIVNVALGVAAATAVVAAIVAAGGPSRVAVRARGALRIGTQSVRSI